MKAALYTVVASLMLSAGGAAVAQLVPVGAQLEPAVEPARIEHPALEQRKAHRMQEMQERHLEMAQKSQACIEAAPDLAALKACLIEERKDFLAKMEARQQMMGKHQRMMDLKRELRESKQDCPAMREDGPRGGMGRAGKHGGCESCHAEKD